MLLNPRYGAFAFITMPYFLLYEVLGVFFELASVGFVVYGWLKGILDVRTFLAFLALMLFSQMFISVLCLFGFVRGQRSIRAGHVAYMVFLSLVELFWYRWLVSVAKIIGTLGYLSGRRSYDMYKRAKRQKEEGKR
jgi:hypothetical protein